MGRPRRNRCSAEFRAEAVRLARSSADPLAKIARDLGVNPETLRLWVQAARPPSEVPLTDEERGELKRIRREVRQLLIERDILKKPPPSSPSRASDLRVHRRGEGAVSCSDPLSGARR